MTEDIHALFAANVVSFKAGEGRVYEPLTRLSRLRDKTNRDHIKFVHSGNILRN